MRAIAKQQQSCGVVRPLVASEGPEQQFKVLLPDEAARGDVERNPSVEPRMIDRLGGPRHEIRAHNRIIDGVDDGPAPTGRLGEVFGDAIGNCDDPGREAVQGPV